MHPRVHRAVIPATDAGEAFLPATKAIPHAMLPVVDKPILQYLVEEATAAGIDDVALIVDRGTSAIENHFDSVPELEYALTRKQDSDKLRTVTAPAGLVDICTVRRGTTTGPADAILQARRHLDGEPFAVLLPDELIGADDPLLCRMIDIAHQRQTSVVALFPQRPSAPPVRYRADGPEADSDEIVRVGGVDAPAAGGSYSGFAVGARFVFTSAVFDALAQLPDDEDDPFLATLNLLAQDAGVGGGVLGVVSDGRRYGVGDPIQHIQSCVRLAADRTDLGPALRAWLRSIADC